MPSSKRLFDDVLASDLMYCLWPLIAAFALLILFMDRHAPFFAAQRMRGVDAPFSMWKLRTMRGCDDGLPTGGAKAALITPVGQALRRWHLDELPQLWNVLVGDMSLVGPRPPTRRMVEAFRSDFAEVLACRPGGTGRGTCMLAIEEQDVMRAAVNYETLERSYVENILPCKLKIEAHYATRQSFGLDVWILLKTAHLILFSGNRKVDQGRSKWDANVAGL